MKNFILETLGIISVMLALSFVTQADNLRLALAAFFIALGVNLFGYTRYERTEIK